MSSQSNLKKIDDYLERNDYLDLYLFLIVSIDNLHSRTNLLNKSILALSQSLETLLLSLSQNPELRKEEISQTVKNLHYMELEIIQRINIFVELLAVYYHYIRTDIRALPQAVGDRHTFLDSEYRFIEQQNVNTIQEVLKYPNVESFDELTNDEKAELICGLNESISIAQELFADILKFKKNFKPVYNKYKHVMAEVTGAYNFHEKEAVLESRFYVRHRIAGTKYRIYTVPLCPEIIIYFKKVSRNIVTLFELLLGNQLLYLSNEGRDFIPKYLLFKKEETGKRINQITSKVKSCVMPNHRAIIKINKAPPEGRKKMIDAFKENCIYVMKKDIYDKEALKKGRLT